jgi:hypothetical protein
MKYSKGDKVRIRNIGWYEEMLSIPSKLVWQNKLTEDFIGIWCGSHVFREEMREFCGMVMTIQEVGIDFYLMEEDRMGYEFTDEMIAGEDVSWMYDGKLMAERFSDGITLNTPKFKVGDVIVKKDGLTNGYLVSSVGSDYYYLSFSLPNSNGVGVLSVKDQDEWELLSDSDMNNYEFMKSEIVEKPSLIDFMDMLNNEVSLPDGYEFRDGDGNLIAVDKIVLAKKRSKYPITYEECCKVLGYDDRETYCICHTGANERLFESLYRLKVCRDAYWLTAGREMGLDGMWEPDWSDCRKFSIVVEGNEILTDVCLRRNRILVFPNEEMRDEFLKVFRNDIEACKEFL